MKSRQETQSQLYAVQDQLAIGDLKLDQIHSGTCLLSTSTFPIAKAYNTAEQKAIAVNATKAEQGKIFYAVSNWI
jgi:hypothetical protein